MAKKVFIKEINGNEWVYSLKVEEHFFSPKNVMRDESDENNFNAVGEVGSPACGDLMKIWLKINPKTQKITDFKWKTFGCASAIASTSILSEMAIGKTLDKAYQITPKEIIEALGGLPKRKIHCSVLGDQALRAAIDNYRQINSIGGAPPTKVGGTLLQLRRATPSEASPFAKASGNYPVHIHPPSRSLGDSAKEGKIKKK